MKGKIIQIVAAGNDAVCYALTDAGNVYLYDRFYKKWIECERIVTK